MELRNVIAFLRVAEMESFTRAANALGYSQSTITIQIRQLEEELGYRLFDRIGKTVSLTPRGRKFFPYANQLATTAQQIKMLNSDGEPPQGALRIGILESLFTYVFLPQLPKYHLENPNITIQTKMASGPDLLHLLRRNEVDVVFSLGQRLLEPDCIRAFEHEVNIVFIASSQAQCIPKKEMSFEEVVQLPLMLTERSSIYRMVLEQEAAKRDIELRPFLEVDSTAALLDLVKAGLGISFLPEYVVKSGIKYEELTTISVCDCHTSMWSQIFYHKNKWVTPQMKAFIQTIKNSNLD